jgi:molybdenum cofactor biosynthesis protein B
MKETNKHHKSKAACLGPIAVAITTVSDSRTADTDPNGAYLRGQLVSSGHTVADYRVIPDDPELLQSTLDEIAASDAQVLLLNGGTGLSKRDNTFDVLDRFLEKQIPGFGELFRFLSFKQIGSAAMLSRATAGTYRGLLVFSTPGSPKAVRLAWEELIEPELQHLVWELGR